MCLGNDFILGRQLNVHKAHAKAPETGLSWQAPSSLSVLAHLQLSSRPQRLKDVATFIYFIGAPVANGLVLYTKKVRPFLLLS
jgi:hypothetical protein